MALFSMVDIVVFFAVLLVGFAYVWKRGDLDWVRALSKERAMQRPSAPGRLVRRRTRASRPECAAWLTALDHDGSILRPIRNVSQQTT